MASKVRNSKQKIRNRAVVCLGLLLVLGFGMAIIGCMRAGLIKGNEYRQKAQSEQLSDTKINAHRGTITDRNGNVLAQSADAWKIFIDPFEIAKNKVDARAFSHQLAQILKVDENDIYAATQNTKSKYHIVKTKVDDSVKKKIEKLQYSQEYYNLCVGYEKDVVRYYPYDNAASTVLGFATANGGSSGLEYYYNSTLSGVAGRNISAKNAKQETISSTYGQYYSVREGINLQLTIDQVIQYYLDSALSEAVHKFDASNGYGIVMDTKTGAILAMSSQPDYNCNKPYEISDESTRSKVASISDKKEQQQSESSALYSQWRNHTVSDSYEPGSVFKCITAAAGIEEGVVTQNEMFVCTGSYKVQDRIYHCSNRAGHGREDFTHSLMNSCNPIYIEVAQQLGSKTFSKYFDAFGMSEKTGVDLPSEFTPKAGVTYYSADAMGPVQLASCSFGQSFQVSPIQVCTAINAIGNGGKLMQPYLVDKWLDNSGNTIRVTKPVEKRQVVSKQTASTVADMMEQVCIGGTAKNAYVPGYRIAGKTGTSEKLNKSGKLYIGSFCGFAPVDDPRITCLIVIDEPKSGTFVGGSTAAPVAAEVMQNTLRYLNVEPEYNEKESANLDVRTPNEIGVESKAAQSALKAQGFTVRVIGNGRKVVSQNPAPGKLIPQKGIVVLYTDTKSKTVKVEVPNLTGLSFAQARARALAAGLNIESTGQGNASGSSFGQSIAAGNQVAIGSVITVSYVSTDSEMKVEDTGSTD